MRDLWEKIKEAANPKPAPAPPDTSGGSRHVPDTSTEPAPGDGPYRTPGKPGDQPDSPPDESAPSEGVVDKLKRVAEEHPIATAVVATAVVGVAAVALAPVVLAPAAVLASNDPPPGDGGSPGDGGTPASPPPPGGDTPAAVAQNDPPPADSGAPADGGGAPASPPPPAGDSPGDASA
jgi:hypothetical protein